MAGQDRATTGALNPAAGSANGSHDPLDGLLRGAVDDPEVESPRRMTTRPIDRAAREALWDRLNVEPWSFDFFALVRRIEALHHDEAGFGQTSRATEDPLRFGQEPSLAFPPCTVSQYHFAKSNAPPRLFVNFMGMLGPMGPMPLHITEYAYQRQLHAKDRTLARFLDIFNHRMISLFYRAWAGSQMPASFDRGGPPVDGSNLSDLERERLLATDADRYAVYAGSLVGLGMEEVRYRDSVPDPAKMHFTGRLVGWHRGPEGLAAILKSYFKVDAHIEEFAGRWLELPRSYWCKFGEPGPSTTLGTLSGGNAVAGTRVWDCQGMFRVQLGPMSLADYERLLPGTPSAARLDAWVRNYVGDEFSWEVVLMLKSWEVPRTRLGAGARLGWTTWIKGDGSPEDRGDLTLRSPR